MGDSSCCQNGAGLVRGCEEGRHVLFLSFLPPFPNPVFFFFLWMGPSAITSPSPPFSFMDLQGFVTRGWEPRNLAATGWPSSTSLFYHSSVFLSLSSSSSLVLHTPSSLYPVLYFPLYLFYFRPPQPLPTSLTIARNSSLIVSKRLKECDVLCSSFSSLCPTFIYWNPKHIEMSLEEGWRKKRRKKQVARARWLHIRMKFKFNPSTLFLCRS